MSIKQILARHRVMLKADKLREGGLLPAGHKGHRKVAASEWESPGGTG